MVAKAVFDVINIEYQYENEDDTDYWPYTMTVSVEHDENKHFSFTEDAIRAELESYISHQQGEPVKVVDLTAFYTGTKDPLRGNYEDYEAETFEAREKKIGSIRIVKNPNFPSGTSLQAYIKTNRAELRKVFGNPNMGESADGKSKGKEWNLVVGPHRVTIYDKREKDKKGTKYFNIGGSSKYGALLVAQALSIHRNERVYAKETVPQWLEDKRQYQQVKSIDEHPDLTYERAKEYEDNRRRYRAESENDLREQFVEVAYDEILENVPHEVAWESGGHLHTYETYDELVNGISSGEITPQMMRDCIKQLGAENLEAEDDLTFKEWADQEMMTHGGRESFDDWLDDELKSHGDNISLQDWGHHELDSHYERYGAEDYQKKMYQDFLDNWDDEWEGSPPTFEEWKELVKGAENWGGDPKGQLARALQKAREKAKKPQKPLKIEKLDAETSDYEKLEYIHSTLQDCDGDEVMIQTSLGFVEDLREPHFNAETKQFAFERLTQGYYDDDERFLVFQSNINLDDYYSKADFNENSPYFHSIHSRIDDALEEFHRLSQENHDKYHQLRRKSDGGFIMKGEIAPYLREDNYYAETSGQWEIGEQLEEAQMNAEGKKRSGVLSDSFDELSLDSGDWKGIVAGFGIGLLALFGYSKLRK